MKKWDIKILILSRGRSETISTHKLLPDFIEVLVPDDEKSAYEKNIKNPIVTIPKEIKGLGQVRNWVLDNCQEEIVIMIDDDCKKFYCLTGEKTRSITDKEEVLQVLINTAIMAKDLGVHCFGYSQTDIRKYNGTEPFRLCTWVGCIIGIIGRKYRFRNDYFKVDVDYCLQNLMIDRIVWVDNRYYCYQNRDNNTGGNSQYRTAEEFEKSCVSLIEKWGECIKSKKKGSQIEIKLNVERRQKIDI